MNMDYADTYTSEIFQKSKCLTHEQILYNDITDILENLGFVKLHAHVYQCNNRRVILAIVDDPEHANYEKHEDFYSSLTANDVIITDAVIMRPVLAKIITLPPEWFGIYAFTPIEHADVPDRFFSLPINRIDFNRALLMLRMQFIGRLMSGYVNFNCANHDRDQTMTKRLDLWRCYGNEVNQWHSNKYQRSMLELETSMPYRNHDLDHDTVFWKSAINIVVETYSSDFSISVSEKIFRALVTPRLWTVLAAPWTVCYLEKLGFDVMSDVVNHGVYDRLRIGDDKIPVFVKYNHDIMSTFQRIDGSVDSQWFRQNILPRAQQAAQHNVRLLSKMSLCWHEIKERWLSENIRNL
jgi:hypothetical protein